MQDDFNVHNSLAEKVAEILRTRILQGEYQIGEKLIESRIAAEFQVSRTPIRDAFRELEKEQLVEYIPNKGCFAKGFSREDMLDIFDVRREVEQLAIRRVIAQAADDDLARLDQLLGEMRWYTVQQDRPKILEANEAFHQTLYRLTGSRFIVRMMRTYQEYIQLARREALRRDENLEEIFREHEAIARAVIARDESAAVDAVAEHMRNSARRASAEWGK